MSKNVLFYTWVSFDFAMCHSADDCIFFCPKLEVQLEGKNNSKVLEIVLGVVIVPKYFIHCGFSAKILERLESETKTTILRYGGMRGENHSMLRETLSSKEIVCTNEMRDERLSNRNGEKTKCVGTSKRFNCRF